MAIDETAATTTLRWTQAEPLRVVLVAGVPFLWLGMVVAISLMEAPLRFQAEGVSREEALAVGQLVFPALNVAEVVLAAVFLLAAWPRRGPLGRAWPVGLATAAILLLQVALVRPILHSSSADVLAGASSGGSSWHLVYVALEGVKISMLLGLGWFAVRAVVGRGTAAAPDERDLRVQ